MKSIKSITGCLLALGLSFSSAVVSAEDVSHLISEGRGLFVQTLSESDKSEQMRLLDNAEEAFNEALSQDKGNQQATQFLSQIDAMRTRITAKPTSAAVIASKKAKTNSTLSVSEKIDLAYTYIGQKYLMTPAGRNAFDLVQSVLKIDPKNQAAINARYAIANTYHVMADDAILKYELEKAKLYISRADKVLPNHRDTAMLKNKVKVYARNKAIMSRNDAEVRKHQKHNATFLAMKRTDFRKGYIVGFYNDARIKPIVWDLSGVPHRIEGDLMDLKGLSEKFAKQLMNKNGNFHKVNVGIGWRNIVPVNPPKRYLKNVKREPKSDLGKSVVSFFSSFGGGSSSNDKSNDADDTFDNEDDSDF